MGIKLTGLNELRRKLDDLQRRAENLNGPVAFGDLFPPEFMRRYTDFKTIEEMLGATGHDVRSSDEFEALPPETWEHLTTTRTTFSSWDEMKSQAAREYASRRLGFDSL